MKDKVSHPFDRPRMPPNGMSGPCKSLSNILEGIFLKRNPEMEPFECYEAQTTGSVGADTNSLFYTRDFITAMRQVRLQGVFGYELCQQLSDGSTGQDVGIEYATINCLTGHVEFNAGT